MILPSNCYFSLDKENRNEVTKNKQTNTKTNKQKKNKQTNIHTLKLSRRHHQLQINMMKA